MARNVTWQDLSISADFDAQISVETLSSSKTRISLLWTENVGSPSLSIHWAMPIVDMEYRWTPACGKNRSIRPDFAAPDRMRISSWAPVYCFYNTKGRNRFTFALSDAKTDIRIRAGVHEEDGCLRIDVQIPLNSFSMTKEYEVILYRDRDHVSFAEAIRRVTYWWENECGMRPMAVPDAARRPMYSTWYSYHQATIAADIEEECRQAKEYGLSSVIVDDGWQTTDGNRGYAFCGDWENAEPKIPDMRAHVEHIHALGMKYILWYSVPFVGKYSKAFHTFENKFLQFNERRGTGVLDPRWPECREYLVSIYVRALKEWDLDGFKLDFIDSFVSSVDAPPYAPGMDYASVESAVERLMTDVMHELRTIKSDILIEFRQSYIGPIMRTYGNMFRVGDCADDELSNRVGTIDLRLLSGSTAVHSDMLMWHPGDSVQNAARQLLSVIFAVTQISVRFSAISEEHREMLRFWIAFMDEHRQLLSSDIEVESPQNLYPLVRARNGEEEAIALYECVPAKLSDAKTTYLFNVTSCENVILRGIDSVLHAKIRDCTGKIVDERYIAKAGICELHVPVCGMALLRS